MSDVSAEPGLGYLYKLVERMREVQGFAQQALTMAEVQQKWAYGTRSRGENFAVGTQVWV